MSFRTILDNAYKQSLQDAQSEALSDSLRQKNISRINSAAQFGLNQLNSYLTTQALNHASAVGTVQSLYPAATPALETPVAIASPFVASSTAPTLGPTVAAASGTAGGATAGATTASGATAGQTASSALSTTGIGAIIGAGLAVGSATPGSWLFPAKKLGYNALRDYFYNPTGGAILDKAFGKWSPQGVVNQIFGDPNEQEKQAGLARMRAIALGQLRKSLSGGIDEE